MARRLVPTALFLVLGSVLARAESVPTALQEYVQRPDSSYRFEIKSRPEPGKSGITIVEMTSQTWQDIRWRHSLYIFEPAKVEFPTKVFLFNTGGKIGEQPNVADQALGLKLAQLTGTRVAMLFQVPNQPLLGNRVEDDLLTETFLRFLATKDATWPALFPMVKSVVRAMDTVQRIAEKHWEQPVDGFLVSGASKRGWTTWLSAVADRRIFAIAPIVIDMLNVGPQMKYQIATWGDFSEQIRDYTSKGLVSKMEHDPDNPLWHWLDPYTYRRQLTLPKLLVNGTNDPYWTVDALNNYWDGLVGPKYVLYVPNAAHGLEGGRDLAMRSLAAFFRHTAVGQPMPSLTWKHDDAADGLRLTVRSNVTPKEVLAWTATSSTKDFRKSKWESSPAVSQGSDWLCEAKKTAGKHIALFAELRFDGEGNCPDYSLSTQLRRD